MKKTLNDILEKHGKWLLLLFLLGWVSSGLNAFVENPANQKRIQDLTRSISYWKEKAIRFENIVLRKDLIIKRKNKEIERQKFRLESSFYSKDAIKTYSKPEVKIEVQYVKEPVDSMLVYTIIYKKIESEAKRIEGKSGYKPLK
jgi:hypothetical protein